MADLQLTTAPAEIALVAATAKTVLMIEMPTNQRGKLLEWGVYFDGVSAVAEAAVVELARATSSGTMSATGTVKVNPDDSETIQSVATINATVEPTITDVVERKNIHPQSGYEKAYGLGSEVKLPGASRLVIRITAPANVNVIPYFKIEE